MKIHPIIQSAAIAMGLLSFTAQAAESDSIRRCMDVFAAQNFPNTQVTFVVEDNSHTPLIAQTGTQSVQLVATAKSSGRLLAKTTCRVRDSVNREGRVLLMPLGQDDHRAN